ncbi:MAG: anti-sigma factor family protein [Pirellulales bacterium]
MRCDEFEARLNHVLDDRRPLSSADDLQSHLRQCGGCREMARSYEALLAGLGRQAVPPAPAWLTGRVLDDVTRGVRPPDRPRLLRFPQRTAIVSLAAAVLLLAVGMAWLNYRKRVDGHGPPGDDQTSVAQAQGAKTLHSATGAVNPPQESNPSETSPDGTNPDGTKPDETSAAENIGAFPPVDWAPAGAEWAQDVADGLQPVTQPTMGAISGFLNLWGIGQQGHRS